MSCKDYVALLSIHGTLYGTGIVCSKTFLGVLELICNIVDMTLIQLVVHVNYLCHTMPYMSTKTGVSFHVLESHLSANIDPALPISVLHNLVSVVSHKIVTILLL